MTNLNLITPRRILRSFLLAQLLLPSIFVAGAVNAQDNPSASWTVYIPATAKQYSAIAGALGPIQGIRTVSVPFTAESNPSDQSWTQAGVMWFGTNGQGPNSANYADVRMLYASTGLHVRITPVDYYLWWPDDPPGDIDLTQWDSMSIQIDTAMGRSGTPQPTDYQFLVTATMWVNPSKPNQYRREARGTGSGWDFNWTTNWSGSYGMVWSSNPGPNNNGGTLDYGADVSFVIPWSSLGMSGPPAAGTKWGFSVTMYDRDGSAANTILPRQNWPETANTGSPSTWGQLHFGAITWNRPAVPQTGRTFIRAASPTDPAVQDAWVGGGGTCGGGHEGGSETNHGSDTSLFVASQVMPADFPCFSRSYLKFSLSSVPANKTIISATLKLHHWGGANPVNASPSYIQAFRIGEDWDQSSIHWNNAPLAMENLLPGTWVAVRGSSAQTEHDPYTWDVSRFVAAAYADGKMLNVALYSGDTEMDSSKYLSSSNVYDIYAERRPSLEILWGDR